MTEFPPNYDEELLGLAKDQQPFIAEDLSEFEADDLNSPDRLQINLDDLANASLLNIVKPASNPPTPSGSYLLIDDAPYKGPGNVEQSLISYSYNGEYNGE